MSELHLAWALSFPREEEPFEAAVRYRQLDKVTISDFRGGRFTGRRAGADAGGADELRVGVLINLSGQLVCRYSGAEILVGPNDMLVWDSEIASGFDAVEPHHELSVLLPRSQVPRGIAEAASGVGNALFTGAGSGLVAIAAAQMRAIAGELEQLSDAALAIACQGFFDTLDSAVAHLAEPGHPPGARSALVARVRRYIDDNLDDPDLCASSIAAAHAVSVRTLHLAFADSGTTVSRWIRDRRLRICYRELSRPGNTKTATAVAFEWGFNDAAHFSRTFKKAFGVTPTTVMARRNRPIDADDSGRLHLEG